MKVYYDDSPAGDGKTERAIARMVDCESKTLFITERKASFDELDERIRIAAASVGTKPRIRHIHGDNADHGSVANTLSRLPADNQLWAHLIVVATHEGMLRTDFSDFSGWRIVVDEVPRFLDFQEKRTALDAAFFQHHYQTEEVEDGWQIVTATQAGRALCVADVRQDQSHAHLDLFHARVLEASQPNAHRYVLCNLANWEAMNGKAVQWCWASAFSFRALAAFDHVELLGNRFRDDIGSRITATLDGSDVEWLPLPASDRLKSARSRDVRIHYFSDRPSSKSWFSATGGQAILREISRYLGNALPASGYIWTANETGDRASPSPKSLIDLSASLYLKPKQAGTNRHQGAHHAAIIYAAKPSQNLRSLLGLFRIDTRLWTESVEHETVLQFVTRTSIRDPQSTEPVSLYVFDRAQADYLRNYFDAQPHLRVSATRVPLIIDIPPASQGGRPAVVRTPEEEELRRAKRRRDDAARKRRDRQAHAAIACHRGAPAGSPASTGTQ